MPYSLTHVAQTATNSQLVNHTARGTCTDGTYIYKSNAYFNPAQSLPNSGWIFAYTLENDVLTEVGSTNFYARYRTRGIDTDGSFIYTTQDDKVLAYTFSVASGFTLVASGTGLNESSLNHSTEGQIICRGGYIFVLDDYGPSVWSYPGSGSLINLNSYMRVDADMGGRPCVWGTSPMYMCFFDNMEYTLNKALRVVAFDGSSLTDSGSYTVPTSNVGWGSTVPLIYHSGYIHMLRPWSHTTSHLVALAYSGGAITAIASGILTFPYDNVDDALGLYSDGTYIYTGKSVNWGPKKLYINVFEFTGSGYTQITNLLNAGYAGLAGNGRYLYTMGSVDNDYSLNVCKMILSAHITADPVIGPAPLTVNFSIT